MKTIVMYHGENETIWYGVGQIDDALGIIPDWEVLQTFKSRPKASIWLASVCNHNLCQNSRLLQYNYCEEHKHKQGENK